MVGRQRQARWGFAYQGLDVGSFSGRFCSRMHKYLIWVPTTVEDEHSVRVNNDTEIKTEIPHADGLYLRKTREAQVTL